MAIKHVSGCHSGQTGSTTKTDEPDFARKDGRVRAIASFLVGEADSPPDFAMNDIVILFEPELFTSRQHLATNLLILVRYIIFRGGSAQHSHV
jgi:hypothetical protein